MPVRTGAHLSGDRRRSQQQRDSVGWHRVDRVDELGHDAPSARRRVVVEIVSRDPAVFNVVCGRQRTRVEGRTVVDGSRAYVQEVLEYLSLLDCYSGVQVVVDPC